MLQGFSCRAEQQGFVAGSCLLPHLHHGWPLPLCLTRRCQADCQLPLPCRDDGVGLAAPQVGVNLRLMVFNETGDPKRRDKEVVLVNPVITQVGRGLQGAICSLGFSEGCGWGLQVVSGESERRGKKRGSCWRGNGRCA